ncbi:MAG: hypothetical protein M3O36_08525, partial [Myxococcota bacterium]|nr:hypothetical protein [Myxococcota bacterium]
MVCPFPTPCDRLLATPSSTAIVFALACYSVACGGDPQPAPRQVDSGSLVDATLLDGVSNPAAEGGPKAAAPADAEAGAPVPTTDATSPFGGDGSPPSPDSVLDGSSADVSPAEAGAVTLSRSAAPTPVSPFAYGQNYWNWVDWSHNGVTGLTGTEALVGALHLNVLRAGGINNDENTPQPFDAAQIDRYVAYCRRIGAEPILQAPIVANPIDGGATSARTAADMVTYANVTKGYGIQYWEIGNEPDSYDMYFDAGVPLNAADHCALFSSYAAAMRAANGAAPGAPPLRLVGPDLAWKYIPGHDWLTPFLDGCKNDVDVVSVHRYPFSGAQLTPAAALADDARFRADVAVVRAIVQAHARPGTPLAITESNVSYDYAPAKYADAARPAEPGTFDAALWTADAVGVALESGLWSFALWNLGERSGGSVLGFLVNAQPTPQYYALKLFSTNVTGTMLS